ncbi:MAG: DUF2735 domain-containing protein [Geminicoccaceae bacterium]
MDTGVRRESAKIYVFPVRARARPDDRDGSVEPRAESAVAHYKAAVGSGWYHEAAIQEADRARKR